MSLFTLTSEHSEAEVHLLLSATEHDFVRDMMHDIGDTGHLVYTCVVCGFCVCLHCDVHRHVDATCNPEEKET